jgi:hypothetical protein
VALRRRGWRITHLDTNSPIGAVAEIARSMRPAVVVLLSMNPDNFLDHAREIRKLARQVPAVIAGLGATPRSPGRRRRAYWIKTRKAPPDHGHSPLLGAGVAEQLVGAAAATGGRSSFRHAAMAAGRG